MSRWSCWVASINTAASPRGTKLAFDESSRALGKAIFSLIKIKLAYD